MNHTHTLFFQSPSLSVVINLSRFFPSFPNVCQFVSDILGKTLHCILKYNIIKSIYLTVELVAQLISAPSFNTLITLDSMNVGI